ncbi:DUF4112 domain-containing protein [Neolewinella litorea]|uniref:DUF4112 domain-containing protein n=1 Tax=Neolewinella litorea TaxID=2562452 RepID=A0A4S4NJK4_9BACT|nr:DUF4112 domain-containing protein [Neolewinella litorea]THH39962.1 DUF4112 domain-containing protein [Neolewinella litorea]
MHQPDHPILTEAQRSVPQLQWVDTFSRVLDTKFRIPGTGVRFGLDFILGLVPGAGDILSLGMSGTLVATMARHGASPRLVARMLVNVVLDAFVGSVPVLGNIFDLFYKANYRNAELMREYYEEGRHRGSVWPVVLAVIVSILILMILLVWVTFKIFEFIFSLF